MVGGGTSVRWREWFRGISGIRELDNLESRYEYWFDQLSIDDVVECREEELGRDGDRSVVLQFQIAGLELDRDRLMASAHDDLVPVGR